MKIEMYVLCLLRFRDGRIVFGHDELTRINVAIGADLQDKYLLAGGGQNGESRDGFKVYHLDSEKVKTRISEEVYRLDPMKASWVNENVKIKSAKVGYYHHRVIVYLKLNSAGDFSNLREIRDLLTKWADETIEHCVEEKINELVRLETIREEAAVEFRYTYPLIVLKKRRKRSKAFPFSEETSSLCFNIVEPSWFKPPWGRRHMMRISIPSTILYPSNWGVGTDLRRDIINVIYQYCLYEKKSMDKRPFTNALDENILTNLWTQIVDRMRNRTNEAHTIRLNLLTILLIILTLIAVIVPLILRYLGD